MKYLKSYNESLRDKMKPKSDEEILKGLSNLTPNELLFKSTENNFLKGVKKAIDLGVDINIVDKHGWTALMYTSVNGDKKIAELLIQNGADINIRNYNENVALIIATMNNQKEIIKLLIQNGADINIKNRFGRTALDLAFYKKFNDIVELLKKYGATE